MKDKYTPDSIHFTQEANDSRANAYGQAIMDSGIDLSDIVDENLDALDRLIASVEAGEVRPYVIEEMAAPNFHWDVWPKFGPAYSGSLDAAVSIKDALLPGWDWQRGENGLMFVTHTDGDEGAWCSGNPSRALLLATLKAYRHTIAEGGDDH